MTGRPEGDRNASRSRRRFLGALGAASAGFLTGCAPDSGGSVRAPEDFPDGAATVWVPVRPTAIDLGPGPTTPPLKPLVGGFFHAPVLPVREPAGGPLPSGHTWSLSDREVSVPCVVEDCEVTPEGRVRLTVDDRITYWNGDPVTARAYWLRDRLHWIANRGAGGGQSFDGELDSDRTYLRPSYVDVDNEFEATWDLHPGRPPLPPSVLEPAVERVESAGTDEQVATEYGDVVAGKTGVERFAEEGYGTGPYEVRSPDDVVRETRSNGATAANVVTAYAYRRDDYPVSVPIPGLAVVGPASPGTNGRGFVGNATLDAGSGVVAPDGDFTPEFVDDGIEQVAAYPTPARYTGTILFNWANPHLRRLWVRRALAAALALDRLAGAVPGVTAQPPADHVGLPAGMDEATLGTDFLDSLVEYPVESDHERASSWLREAGYELDGDRWIGPGGASMDFELVVHGPVDEQVARVLEPALEAFGVAVRTVRVRDRAYHERMLGLEYDLAVQSLSQGWGVSGFYGDWYEAGDGWLSTPTLTAVGEPPSSCREDPVAAAPATVTLPAKPGLRVEGVDYPDGGSTYRWEGGEDVSVCEATARLRRSGVDAETYREAARTCARWYNYAVPTLLFAQEQVGLWVDTDELAAPSSDHPSTRVTAHAPEPRDTPATPLPPHYYHLHAGTLRPR